MRRLLSAAILIFLSLGLCAESKHHFYLHYSHADGLPATDIGACAQDGFGRLWVGTREGVYFYSGDGFLPFLDDTYRQECSPNTIDIIADRNNCIWIATTTGIGYFDVERQEFQVIEDLAESVIRDVDVAGDGTIWITTRSGIWKYSHADGSLNIIDETSNLSPTFCCVTEEGNLVFTANNSFIYVYDTSVRDLRVITVDDKEHVFSYIENIGDGLVLVADGIKSACTVNTRNGVLREVVGADILENKSEIYSLMYRAGSYWIGTSYGLVIYEASTGMIERQFPDVLDDNLIGGESIRCMIEDKDGNVWAGTYNGGLRGWTSYENGFNRYIADEGPGSLVGNAVRAICEGFNGELFIGTEEGYLNSYDPDTRVFTDYTSRSGIPYGTAITGMIRNGNIIWISTYGEGVYTMDASTKRFRTRYSMDCNDCLGLYMTESGDVFAATGQGLFQYNAGSDKFETVNAVGRRFVHCLIEDEPGRLLIGLYGKGFGVYDQAKETFKTEEVLDKTYIISEMYKDSQGAVWMATSGMGLHRFELSSLQDGSRVLAHESFLTENGMPTNTIRNLFEDRNKVLWVTTSDGLVEIDMESLKIRKTYLQRDNVVGSQFSYCKCFESSEGMLYFGTNKGLLTFQPDYFRSIFKNPELRITRISVLSSLDNRTLQNQDGYSVLTSKSIKIKQKEAAYLSISFSPMVYGSPNKMLFDCSLSANRYSSQFITDENHISFTNLRPGQYSFKVNYSGSEDSSTEADIDITIKAEWYKSVVARILYLSLLILLAWGIFRLRRNRLAEEAQHRNELLETQKEKEIVREKMELLTNISHEIRTPVSVIQILLDKINSVGTIPDSIAEEFDSLKLNVDNLKKMCNELLDFRKLESGQAMMVFADEDIVPICLKVVDTFATAAKNKGISLETEIGDSPILVHCDDSAIESILCNLLSNAIKYCNTRIIVRLELTEDKLAIRVGNDGNRISDNDKEDIFKAFYQLEDNKGTGSGLGLTYSRKIAELHNGRLFLDTEDKEFTSFVLELPKLSAEVTAVASQNPNETDEEASIREVMTIEESSYTTILVVEDNKSMRDLISSELSREYRVLTAQDGVEALQMVKDEHVDLVVSDIMMPNMDGCQLCNAIKEDMELSHIPVLLLTAAVGIETHIRSLKSGADAYIEKPFKMNILKENINALFRNRDIRNRQFSSSPLSHLTCSNVSKVEQNFINKLHEYVHSHISESELTIGVLANVMNVSKPTLARKIKAATGLTVNEYVRLCRLKQAAEMLAENKYRINEVAYLVGYTSPSYFAQCFQKQFNKLPSDFIKS